MSYVINPFLTGSSGAATPYSASFKAVKSATTQQTIAASDNNQEIVFDSVSWDTFGSSFASNRFTVPGAYSGRYMNFTAGVETTVAATHNIYIEVSTDGGTGWTEIAVNGDLTSRFMTASTGPFLAATDDIFRVRYELPGFASDTFMNNTDKTFFSGYVT